MIKSKQANVASYPGWRKGNAGYLKTCEDCGERIYLKEDYDSLWRPYESWIAGNCARGEWILHRCR